MQEWCPTEYDRDRTSWFDLSWRVLQVNRGRSLVVWSNTPQFILTTIVSWEGTRRTNGDGATYIIRLRISCGGYIKRSIRRGRMAGEFERAIFDSIEKQQPDAKKNKAKLGRWRKISRQGRGFNWKQANDTRGGGNNKTSKQFTEMNSRSNQTL